MFYNDLESSYTQMETSQWSTSQKILHCVPTRL